MDLNKAFEKEFPGGFENYLRQEREELLKLKEKAKGPVSKTGRIKQRAKLKQRHQNI